MADATLVNQARPRLQQLFAFLQAFHLARNPVVVDFSNHPVEPLWWDDLPQTPDIVQAPYADPATDGTGSTAAQDIESGDEVLSVKRPKPGPPEAPRPPVDATPFVTADWQNPEATVAWTTERVDADEGVITLDERQRLELV